VAGANRDGESSYLPLWYGYPISSAQGKKVPLLLFICSDCQILEPLSVPQSGATTSKGIKLGRGKSFGVVGPDGESHPSIILLENVDHDTFPIREFMIFIEELPETYYKGHTVRINSSR
jgi:hypothetical protein